MKGLIDAVSNLIIPASAPVASRVTILCVDDDPQIRTLFHKVVSEFDVVVETASTPSEALSKISQADILLLDWKLNGSDGGVVLDEWKRAHKGAPVAVLTGQLEAAELDNLYLRGVFNAFLKPTGTAVVLKVVSHYLQMVRAQRRADRIAMELAMTKRLCIMLAIVLVAVAAGGQIPQWLL